MTSAARWCDAPSAEITLTGASVGCEPGRATAPLVLGFAVIWSAREPERLGEIALVTGSEPHGFGRAPGRFHSRPLMLAQPRTGETPQPLRSPGISRVQWLVRRVGGRLEIENVGRAALVHNGCAVTRATAAIGDVVEIAGELALLIVARPAHLPSTVLPPALLPAFGQADALGIVGESYAAWELRRQLAFAARRDDHVLIAGPSGSGKELAAGALHQLSRRAVGPLVARNAATFPDSLIDAELFGNARDYPNPGMTERPGLLGAADGSTLFLDEIGELPHAMQAHLLRVLDGGEYQRLGEARSRRSSARLIAATNRAPHELKHDLLARLRLRITLPGLEQRREDIPLIARHLLRTMASRDPELARFFHNGDPTGEPRWSARFVTALVTAPLIGHVREIAALLYRAMMDAGDGVLDGMPPSTPTAIGTAPTLAPVEPRSLGVEQIRAALDACGGVQERAWRALGLRSRYQLIRLMRKLGITDRVDRAERLARSAAAASP